MGVVSMIIFFWFVCMIRYLILFFMVGLYSIIPVVSAILPSALRCFSGIPVRSRVFVCSSCSRYGCISLVSLYIPISLFVFIVCFGRIFRIV